MPFPRVAKAQPRAGISERFQRCTSNGCSVSSEDLAPRFPHNTPDLSFAETFLLLIRLHTLMLSTECRLQQNRKD